MRSFFVLLFFSFLVISCQKPVEVDLPPLIPQPQSVMKKQGIFELTANDGHIAVYYQNEFALAGSFLGNYLLPIGEAHLDSTNAVIRIIKDSSLPDEGYSLQVTDDDIQISAKDASGAYYGVQTLRQLLPISLESSTGVSEKIYLPQLEINDAPAFSYRGMHLDVGRHFFPKEFIKEYIEHLSMLKMNYFHWHLTEDQGWRIEIKQYPRLTSHAAYREETLIGHYSDTPHQFDGQRYGGFYTQEEIREIVEFAVQHNVTIIPEIEMPGHAQAAVSAYPELGCAGEQVPVATKWGVFEHIYCPNQKTFAFLKNVLTEVTELFPGEYIHIGGDEAPKAQWKSCNHCQKLIRDLDLGDENGLQSYFIKEIETFLNGKGKKIIGWDEILEGGLAPNATVMSWRGIQGGIEAAKEGHDVIMTPTSHAYFDYYQDDSPDEPLAIGGFLPLKKVYGFNPIPSELTKEESKYVLGAQGNVWTEYMKTTDKVEYMVFPRILAMSELTWNGPTENIEEDYPEFLSRVEPFFKRLEALDVNYANHLYKVDGEVVKNEDGVYFELSTPTQGKDITYRINEGEALKYDSPIPITENTTLISEVSLNDESIGPVRLDTIHYHKGITAEISLNVDPHPAYNAGGVEALNNGIMGSDSRYGDGEWLGFWGDDLEIIVDLGESRKVNTVSTRFYHSNGQWIYSPVSVKIGIYKNLSDTPLDVASLIVPSSARTRTASQNFEYMEDVRYVKLLVKNYGIIPEGKQGAGNPAWTFIDEIIIQ